MAGWLAAFPIFAQMQKSSDQNLGNKGWLGEESGGWTQAATGPGQFIGGLTGQKNMTNYQALSAGADPLGLVSGGGLLHGAVAKAFGYDPSAKKEKGYANAYEQLKAENPALLDQLQKEAMGQGDSAAETLGREMVSRNERALTSASISAEGISNPAAALRMAQQANVQAGVAAEAQIAAQRAEEQRQAQQMLLAALQQSASLDQAMTIFKAQQAERKQMQRNSMIANGIGAGLQAYSAYQQNQNPYSDWAASQNAMNVPTGGPRGGGPQWGDLSGQYAYDAGQGITIEE